MIRKSYEKNRSVFRVDHQAQLCVVGGGLAGVCCAITAARLGVQTVLIQDRPVLGGNSSSEVRLWALGATSHMNNNNRWAREGGVIDEILVENRFRNREGNPLFFDALLLEMVTREPKITLLLNTVVHDVEMDGANDRARIESVTAFCSQNETRYRIRSPLFCDASGDGVVAFLAGAPYRVGAESREEFGEKFAPDPKEYGELLGHSIFFYTKDTGYPVTFTPPSFALANPERKIPRFRNFNVAEQGCQFWWIEYGGRLDTIHDTEKIKWELWSIVYGVWNHIKNSGEFPEAKNLTLEWIGSIPGKRESRRFEGIKTLTQQDIIDQREHEDAVSFGGWSIDLHPSDGIYSSRRPCDQYHSAGVYQIPYGIMVTPAVPNLFLAGRIVSASHVAFGSTRVMATCAHGAQAAGAAAALCLERRIDPAEAGKQPVLSELQNLLAGHGQFIPGYRLAESGDLARQAAITATSSLSLGTLPPSPDLRIPLDFDRAQMVPLAAGSIPGLSFTADSAEACELLAELRISGKTGNFTPDKLLGEIRLSLPAGRNQRIDLNFPARLESAQYVFVCFRRNPAISFHGFPGRITGLLALRHSADQLAPGDAGIRGFELWTPDRRPDGHLFAFSVRGGTTHPFEPENIANGLQRPTVAPNAWVADWSTREPALTLSWPQAKPIRELVIVFDTDTDNAMETVLRGHPDAAMPYCIRDYDILDDSGKTIYQGRDNHQTINRISLTRPHSTSSVTLKALSVWGDAPASVFAIRCFS